MSLDRFKADSLKAKHSEIESKPEVKVTKEVKEDVKKIIKKKK
jgi:hypothetical protein